MCNKLLQLGQVLTDYEQHTEKETYVSLSLITRPSIEGSKIPRGFVVHNTQCTKVIWLWGKRNIYNREKGGHNVISMCSLSYPGYNSDIYDEYRGSYITELGP